MSTAELAGRLFRSATSLFRELGWIGVGVVLGVVLLLLPAVLASAASAASYRWANTHVYDGSVKVEWCAGGTKTLKAGTRTGKDVCRVWLPYGREMFVYVEETGTELIDTAYCGSGSGRWISFTAKTDTSRTARVHVWAASCA